MTAEQICKWRLKNWGSDSEPTIISINRKNLFIKVVISNLLIYKKSRDKRITLYPLLHNYDKFFKLKFTT